MLPLLDFRSLCIVFSWCKYFIPGNDIVAFTSLNQALLTHIKHCNQGSSVPHCVLRMIQGVHTLLHPWFVKAYCYLRRSVLPIASALLDWAGISSYVEDQTMTLSQPILQYSRDKIAYVS